MPLTASRCRGLSPDDAVTNACTCLDLSWRPPPNVGGQVTPVTGYLVAFQLSEKIDDADWLPAGAAFATHDEAALPLYRYVHSAAEPKLSLEGLSPGTEYAIAVLPKNAFGWGSSWSEPTWIATAAPGQCRPLSRVSEPELTPVRAKSTATKASAEAVGRAGVFAPSLDEDEPPAVDHMDSLLHLASAFVVGASAVCITLICACACLLDRRFRGQKATYSEVACDESLPEGISEQEQDEDEDEDDKQKHQRVQNDEDVEKQIVQDKDDEDDKDAEGAVVQEDDDDEDEEGEQQEEEEDDEGDEEDEEDGEDKEQIHRSELVQYEVEEQVEEVRGPPRLDRFDGVPIDLNHNSDIFRL